MTASAITIIELTTEIIKGIHEFYKSAKTAPKEVADLLDELDSFGVILQRLRILSQHAKAAQSQQHAIAMQSYDNLPMLQKIMERDAPLHLCYEELLDIKSKLTNDRSRLKKALKWPFQKEEIQATFLRLRNYKSLLDTAIMSDQL